MRRRLAVLPLAAAFALISGAPAVSGTENPYARCNSGLDRNVAVCNRFQEPGTSGYDACIRDAQITYSFCVQEVREQMDETPGP